MPRPPNALRLIETAAENRRTWLEIRRDIRDGLVIDAEFVERIPDYPGQLMYLEDVR